MIKNSILYIISIIIALTLNSCEKSLEYQASKKTSKLVLYAFPMPDSTFKISASYSSNILEKSSFKYIDNTDVNIYVNNSLYNSSKYPSNTKWYAINNLHGKSLDNYKITLTTANGDKVSANTYIPKAIHIDTVEITKNNDEDDNKQKLNCIVHFSDPATEKNYYQIRIDAINKIDNTIKRTTINYTKDDPVFNYNENESELFIGIDYLGTFNDDLINGTKCEINLSFVKDNLINSGNTVLEFHLYTLSKEYFNYLRSRVRIAENSNMSNILFETKNVYSNVKDGIGVVAGLSVSKYKVKYNDNTTK